MATPLTADQMLTALRGEGVKVVEYKSWRTHNRNQVGPWGPVNGVMIHHTAGTDSLALCYDGRSDLPGPLCHAHLAKDGTVTVVGNGRPNHAGTIAQNAHDAVVAESSTHPRPDAAEPVDGNAHYYGLEIENLGDWKDPYPAVQREAAVRWAAAICRAHGWSEQSVIGHKEGTRRKIDPSFDMVAFRRDVAALLAPELPEEPEMTPPAYTSLEVTETIPGIGPRAWSSLVWGTEHSDPLNMHAPDAKTFLTACQYSGVVEVDVDGLPVGARVRVALAVDDLDGNTVERLVIADQPSTALDGITVTGPAVGKVGPDRRIKVQVWHEADPGQVDIIGARFRGQVWEL